MSDKSIYREEWGSGGLGIAPGETVSGGPQFEERKHLSQKKVRTKQYGSLTHEEFRQYLGENQQARRVNSGGFLSLSHLDTPAAYKCPDCGFEGLFKSASCARCGTSVLKGE